jgi:CBS domain-containing protein
MMTRTDIHLDAMLRHLGAAYYDSLHGRATRTDVARALDTVEEHLVEQSPRYAAGTAQAQIRSHKAQAHKAPRHHQPGRWKRRVQDVMTTSVVTIDRITPYKEIARLLAEHRISGVPVLTMGRHVAGVVSEADLIAIEESRAREARRGGAGRLHLPGHPHPHQDLTAANLMTSPAITIHPEAPIPGAARLMMTHRIQRLPVVDPDGKLIGIVTRRDLLSVFLRPDEEIAGDAAELLADVLHADPATVQAVVRNGQVILIGTTSGAEEDELVAVAMRLIWDVDGVVDVTNRVNQGTGADREHVTANATDATGERSDSPQ